MKHGFSDLSFTYRLVLLSALVSGLVWMVFGGVLFYVAKHNLEEQLTDYQIVMANDLTQTIDRSLFTAHQGIQVLAQDARLIDLLGRDRLDSGVESQYAISEHLERVSLLTGPWRVVTLYDAKGEVVASNMPGALGSSLADHPEAQAALQAGLENRIYHSDLRLLGDDRAPSLLFAAPVHRDGLAEAEVTGVVVGEYGWPVITQSLDSVAPATTVTLLRNDGTIIAARSVASHRVGTQAPGWPALRAATFGSRNMVLDDPSGEGSTLMIASRQAGYLGYQGHDWVLTLETPKKIMLAPVYTLAWQLALAALAGVLVLGAALFATGMYLTKPIGAMSRAVKAFSRGDTAARIAVNDHKESKDELAELARTFNTMAEDIGYYIDQMKENSEEVRAFAYIVSHDLRAPLVNLKGFSAEIGYSLAELKALLKPVLQALPEDKRNEALEILETDVPEALQFIGSSVERMDGQIEAILKLSRLGRRELLWEQVDTRAVVNQVLSSLQHQLAEKHISANLGDMPTVEADPVAMEQIFGNLLDNAVKYMTESPGKIEVWSTIETQGIVFHIGDSGPGIDAANTRKVFDLFRRVGRTDVPGDGMGLAYVKALVRRHGGKIWCESTLGEGSVFSFSVADKPSAMAREASQ